MQRVPRGPAPPLEKDAPRDDGRSRRASVVPHTAGAPRRAVAAFGRRSGSGGQRSDRAAEGRCRHRTSPSKGERRARPSARRPTAGGAPGRAPSITTRPNDRDPRARRLVSVPAGPPPGAGAVPAGEPIATTGPRRHARELEPPLPRRFGRRPRPLFPVHARRKRSRAPAGAIRAASRTRSPRGRERSCTTSPGRLLPARRRHPRHVEGFPRRHIDPVAGPGPSTPSGLGDRGREHSGRLPGRVSDREPAVLASRRAGPAPTGHGAGAGCPLRMARLRARPDHPESADPAALRERRGDPTGRPRHRAGALVAVPEARVGRRAAAMCRASGPPSNAAAAASSGVTKRRRPSVTIAAPATGRAGVTRACRVRAGPPRTSSPGSRAGPRRSRPRRP